MYNNFTYFIPTRILFGRGQLENLHTQALPGQKALIVITAGRSMKANGYLSRLENQLDMAGVEHILFDKILPNPIIEHVHEAAELCKANEIDFIIGLGGGSSIDSAKSIAVMATNDGDYWDYVKGKRKPKSPLPVVAITTTAGTGTEADPWTVITNGKTNEKIGFGYDETYPVLSVVDSELMETVPPTLTAFQGFDALFHATESVINKNENPMGEMFALKAIEYITKYLPIAIKDGSDKEARAYVALANTYAGFYELCTSEHSLEHAMSAYHGELPHGAGLIMISLEYYKNFAEQHACDGQYAKIAAAMGGTDFIEQLTKLEAECGVDKLKMSDYGIVSDEFRTLAQNARSAMGGLFTGDPVFVSEDDCVKIYEKSYR